jgi:nucleotide-binding universal stress UspA family protein
LDRPLERILVAVDGSEPSRQALYRAISIASKLGARVTIAHSVAWKPVRGGENRLAMQQLAKKFDDAGLKMLKALHNQVVESGVKVDLALLHGPPGEAVIKLASAGDYDLVVVGVRGRTLLSRGLLGSVADRIIRLCTRPVLVVH